MSSRRPNVNVSKYLNGLNEDLNNNYEDSLHPDLSVREELAKFTNVNFDFDFEADMNLRSAAAAGNGDVVPPSDSVDGLNSPFTEQDSTFHYFNTIPFTDFSDLNVSGMAYPGPMDHIDPSLGGMMHPYHADSLVSPTTPVMPQHGHQVKHETAGLTLSSSKTTPSRSVDLSSVPEDERARLAAEEDKRRRNTAASARFRDKKKMREKAMEKANKEMTEKVSQLESRIGQLETENRWLKELITEKNAAGKGREEVGEWWKELKAKHAAAKELSS